MVDYAIANQIRPFQLPDIAGIAGAMQGLELNRMRSQQLQGAEQERNALRQLMATPGFDPSSPDAARRLLEVAPTTGAATYQALMAGQREQRQAQAAQTEAGLKAFELSRENLRGIAELPEADRPAAWAAWRAQTEASVPGTRGFIPSQYSPAAYTSMISKASEIARNLTERPTALAGPGGIPVLVDRGTGTFRMGTEVSPAAPAPVSPGAPAPRAEAPSLGESGRDMAAAMLRRSEGFRPEPYMDVNALRAGYGSDTVTLADGRVVPVTQGTRVTQEDAERDLARRIPEFERKAAAAVGEERFAALPPNVRAALISVAYNYGTLPGRIRNAVQSGDVNAIAAAVEGLAGDNQGINARRRGEEAAVIRGANAMAPGAAPANAMLAPPDATVVPRPLSPVEFPGAPRPASLSEADLLRRIRDVQQKEAEALMLEQIRRETAASRAVEEGEKAGSIRRGQLTAEQERKDREKLEGRQRLESVLRDMNTQYERLTARGGIPSESRSAGANIGAFVAGTAPGQTVGRALATPSQTARNQIESLRNELLQAFKAATGMGSKEADSNADVMRLMSAMSDTTMSIESVRGIMQNFSKRYGLGELNFPETTAPAAPAPAAPRESVPSQSRGAAPTQGQFQEGQTATGPNGQRIIFRGGQWVPVQ